MSKPNLGHGLALFAAGSIGSSVAVTTRIGAYPWLGGLCLRYGCAAALLGGVVLSRGLAWPRLTIKDVGLLLVLAATGMVAFNVFLIAAVRHADPGAVGAIVGVVPLLLAVLGPMQDGRSPSRHTLLAAGVVVAGAAMAQGAGSATILGIVLALGALGGEAAFSLLAMPLLPRLGPVFVATYSCLIASAMSFVLGVIVDGGRVLPMPSATEAASFIFLGVMVSGLAFFAWYSAIGRLGVERAGLFTGLAPVFALLTGMAMSAGNPGWLQLLGVIVVGVGVSFGIRRPGSNAQTVESATGSSTSSREIGLMPDFRAGNEEIA